ncbi:hypothetical protein EJ04DRAFT_493316 [Polyplosphaeria fusca]|uniref:Uncharacterized protein n=1 Tax=Polyplosphaeria fusca TaxID=682080 RepID=A0A9P4R0N6_9PLEO|nr:hypothetical protein EJ04DRAFT_493316 [Polyplosphaeria fusca]
MARITDPSEDDWHNVEDARKRKQIQDRLAQRARRKLALPSSPILISPSVQKAHMAVSPSNRPPTKHESHALPSPCWLTAPARPTIQPTPPITVFSALFQNGQLLGLTCSTTVPGKSSPVAVEVPETLHPTMLQLTTIHPMWIDRFPMAKFRDNLISLMGIMDGDDFLKDIFMMPSFTIKEGCAAWDPQGWTVDKDFAEKWGFLFF